jgi:hypothetical protein
MKKTATVSRGGFAFSTSIFRFQEADNPIACTFAFAMSGRALRPSAVLPLPKLMAEICEYSES